MVLFEHLRGIYRYGLREYIKQVWFLREFRGGTLVGIDKYGNKYYEISSDTPNLPFYRKRYVELVGGTDEASQVPAEWHGWLHYTTDDSPSERPEEYPTHRWDQPHQVNLTGTPQRYVPYSTTDRKVYPWNPPNLNLIRAFAFENPALPDHPPINPIIRDVKKLQEDIKKNPLVKNIDEIMRVS